MPNCESNVAYLYKCANKHYPRKERQQLKAASSQLGVLLLLAAVLICTTAFAAEPATIGYTVWGNGNPEKPVIAAFEASHPNIRVEFTAGGSINQYIDKLLVMQAGGALPDVFGINVPNAQRFLTMGIALPLDSLSTRDRVNLDAFLPGSFSYARYQGSLYGFPRGTRGAPFAAQSAMHNRTLFDHAGLMYPTNDWAFGDMLAMAKKLTRRQGDGQVTQWGMEMPSLTFWWNWVWSAGGELISEDNSKVLLTEEKALSGLDFVREMRFVHEVIPPPGSGISFNRGDVGMMIEATFYQGPPNKSFDWSLTGMPRGPQSPSGFSRGGANIVAISAESKRVEAAWEFVKYLVSEEAQRLEVYEERVGNPVLRSIALTARYLKRNEAPWDYTYAVMAPIKIAPAFPEWPDMEAIIKEALKDSWTTNRPARVVLEEIMPSLTSILRNR